MTSTNSSPILELVKVSKNFAGLNAVHEVSLSVNQGEIFALLGGSGCGKTTLLRMMAGFDTPTSGTVLIENDDVSNVPPYQRPVNMMFQSYALFPHMNVEKNVAFGLRQEGLSKEAIHAQVEAMLKLVHMQAYAKRKPHQLSGGQRQRVALARSLAKKPKVLLLDEPMAALDKKLRSQMQLELVDIVESVGVTCVMVTHDQEEAMTMATRVAIMHEGALVQIGTPTEIYEYPNSKHTAEFVGSVNILTGNIQHTEGGMTQLECSVLPSTLQVEGSIHKAHSAHVQVAIRPEKIHINTQQPKQTHNWAQGHIEDIAYLGGVSVYHVRLPSGQLMLATATNIDRHQTGYTWEDSVYLHWSSANLVVLYQ